MGTTTRSTAPAVELRVELGEDRRVALDDAAGDVLVAGPRGVGDDEVARRRPAPPRAGPRRRSRRRPVRPRAPSASIAVDARGVVRSGTTTCAASPRARAARATARPWLPSVAHTSVSAESGARARSAPGSVASAGSPRRSATAHAVAHHAPSALNAGRPKRELSSLSRTAPSPSSAASDGASAAGGGVAVERGAGRSPDPPGRAAAPGRVARGVPGDVDEVIVLGHAENRRAVSITSPRPARRWRADVLLNCVRALAGGPEDDGRDAGGGDEGGVHPRLVADDLRLRAERPRSGRAHVARCPRRVDLERLATRPMRSSVSSRGSVSRARASSSPSSRSTSAAVSPGIVRRSMSRTQRAG